ncbi:alkaline phosphatase [Spiroplasma sp. DGKH1]|uniref:alkaline phosphatase n=1 Tax=Spiroplasma sp. DGKH1 TaxID=3050074 RepID=UPI0034C690F6
MRKLHASFLLTGAVSIAVLELAAIAGYQSYQQKYIEYVSYENKLTHHPKHVVMLAIDGLAAYALQKATIPNIRYMMNHGAYKLDVRSELPNSSAGNWATILLGTGPENHGIVDQPLTNIHHSVYIDEAKLAKQTSIFGLIHQSNLDTGWLATHEKIQTAFVSLLGVQSTALSPDFKAYGQNFIDYYYQTNTKEDSIERYLDVLEHQIDPAKPSFSWMYFLDPDDTGHSREYNSEEYYQALTKTDQQIGMIINKLKAKQMYDDTLFIINSDHGGLSQYHGRPNIPEMTVPWIVYSKKDILQSGVIPDGIKVYDSAPTIAYLMDLKDYWARTTSGDKKWQGKPIASPFFPKPEKEGYPIDGKNI